jgi:hypothetical protein
MSETFTPDGLIAGDYPIQTEAGTLITGQNLARGTVVGKITASGKFTTALSASSDGSQAVYGILADSVDATSADKACVVYISGEFNTNAMTFGTGITIAAANRRRRLRSNHGYRYVRYADHAGRDGGDEASAFVPARHVLLQARAVGHPIR